MTRLRHRPDQFFYRGDRFAFHRLQDGATLGRLDPYSAETQRWLLHSGRTIDVTAEEVRDITKQVHDLDLPDMRPGGGSCNCGERLSAIEARLAVLEAAPLAPPPPAPVLGDKLEGLEEGEIDPAAVMVPDEVSELMMADETLSEAVIRIATSEDALLDLAAALSEDSARIVLESMERAQRDKWVEDLNKSHGDLLAKRGSREEDLVREGRILRILTLFAKVGEKK